jgi:hypothetical protein
VVFALATSRKADYHRFSMIAAANVKESLAGRIAPFAIIAPSAR